MTLDNTTKWIQEVLVPRILKNGEFQGAAVRKIHVSAMEGMKDNWASDMYEINLLLHHQGSDKSISFLLKLMCEDENVRTQMQSDKQFSNEIHFYSTVIPLFASQTSLPQVISDFENLFPECYYSYCNKVKNPQTFEDAVLVMENLKVRGFQLGSRTSLDLKHLSLALQCLGLFHAFSYYMKERDYDKFMNIVIKPIRESNYNFRNEEIINTIFSISEHRIINALAAELPEGDPRLSRLRDLAARNPFEVFTDLIKPQEPLSVFCHGDFLRNNVLFRYDNGEPVEMKFIDFQTSRYASPAIDVSLLICMNTTHELRESHFDELLQVYHTSLTNALATLLGEPKEQLNQRYSFESFLSDFRQHAVYGYMITIEFLPWMFAEGNELTEFVKLNWEEKGSPRYNEFARRLGGERATRELVTLTKDLLERQCL